MRNSKFTPKMKNIFTLAKIEGLTYTEIANYQNVLVRAVERLIKKGVEQIRQKLGNKINIILIMFWGRKKSFAFKSKENYIILSN